MSNITFILPDGSKVRHQGPIPGTQTIYELNGKKYVVGDRSSVIEGESSTTVVKLHQAEPELPRF